VGHLRVRGAADWFALGDLHRESADSVSMTEREKITDRAHGIDVSHYQEQYIYAETWGQVDFAIAKIGEGYNSPYSRGTLGDFSDFNKIWLEGVAQVPIRGVYFYQRSGYSWERQADNLLEAVERLDVKPHMLWNDAERGNNVINKEYLADMLRIMDHWKVNAPQYTTGLYANKDMLQNYIKPIGVQNYGRQYLDRVLAYPLFYAQYYFTGKSPNKQPLMPTFKSNWDIWQYNDSGDSFKIVDGKRWRHYGSPDLDVYNGTVDEMKAWLKIGSTPPPPPPVPVDEREKRNAVLDEAKAAAVSAIEALKEAG
jgi:GH25 family lysozyme M1 (1,4-beta-N-acetylmuramidase)